MAEASTGLEHPAPPRLNVPTAYDFPSMDTAHREANSYPCRPYRYAADIPGRPECPVCRVAMMPTRVRIGSEPHFLCPRSGLVFFGDEEDLSLCVHPREHVRGCAAGATAS